jgi:hypothetical protein
MKTIWFVFLGLVITGCDDAAEATVDEVRVQPFDPLVMVSIYQPPTNQCGPYTESVLPAVGLGDVHVICSACNDTCEALGEPCGSYGAPCDIAGKPGVCVACCSELVGELRCSKLP